MIGEVYRMKQSGVHYVVVDVMEHGLRIRAMDGKRDEFVAPSSYLARYSEYVGMRS